MERPVGGFPPHPRRGRQVGFCVVAFALVVARVGGQVGHGGEAVAAQGYDGVVVAVGVAMGFFLLLWGGAVKGAWVEMDG